MNEFNKHPSNKNLTLYFSGAYCCYPVNVDSGPLIYEYLEKGFRVFHWAIKQHVRTAMFRFDLRFPEDYPFSISNKVISKFTDGLRKAILRDRSGKRHQTGVNFIWVKEYGSNSKRPHYHFALFLNGDAYFRFGEFGSEGNLYSIISRQWANAIGIRYHFTQRFVHAQNNYKYHQVSVIKMNANSINYQQTVEQAFYSLTYLFKSGTKLYGVGLNSFGSSKL